MLNLTAKAGVGSAAIEVGTIADATRVCVVAEATEVDVTTDAMEGVTSIILSAISDSLSSVVASGVEARTIHTLLWWGNLWRNNSLRKVWSPSNCCNLGEAGWAYCLPAPHQ